MQNPYPKLCDFHGLAHLTIKQPHVVDPRSLIRELNLERRSVYFISSIWKMTELQLICFLPDSLEIAIHLVLLKHSKYFPQVYFKACFSTELPHLPSYVLATQVHSCLEHPTFTPSHLPKYPAVISCLVTLVLISRFFPCLNHDYLSSSNW